MWTETGIELRALRGCFLQHGILRAYAGYAADQMRRLESQKTEGRGKTAMHLLRLLISARHLAETGDILVDVSTHRDRLLAIRNGAIPLDHAKEEANAMLSALQQRISGDAHRLLPAQARSDIIEQFVVSTRLKQMGLQEPSPDQTRRPGRTTEPTTSSDHSARSGT
jgi:predicted nucleotidyltransferase